MPRQTRFEARYFSRLTAARGQDRLHAGDGVMTHLGPIGLGRVHRAPLDASRPPAASCR